MKALVFGSVVVLVLTGTASAHGYAPHKAFASVSASNDSRNNNGADVIGTDPDASIRFVLARDSFAIRNGG